MRRGLLIITFLACSLAVWSQELKVPDMDELFGRDEASDSIEFMTLETFMALVTNNHPIVKQSNLLTDMAREELRLARGSFDPKLEASLEGKHFDKKEYYNLLNTTLKVPTWFPIDPKVSVDRNRGLFVNDQNEIPEGDDYRQVTAGLSLPVGRGLFIDQRRAMVKQAVLFQDINEAERIKMINKTMLSAAKAYWDWYFAYYNYRLVQRSLGISEEVYRRVKLDFGFGEAAAVDTVQAAITLQNRTVDQQEALINFLQSGLYLSNFLWGEQEEPLEVGENLIPQRDFDFLARLQPVEVDSLLSRALTEHPELRKINLKLSQLGIDERLAKENLKPRVDVNFNLINAPIGEQADIQEVTLRDNYKFGIEFEFPLFLRKERAKLKQTQIKINQTAFELSQMEREVINDIRASYFALNNTQGMLGNMQTAVDNYRILLEAELFNLNVGESDLFKINFQIDKLLEAESKLMKMKANVEKARVTLFWSAGVPYLNFPVPNLD